MPLISGSIPSLINGVSQQPATLRMPTQGEVQENGLSHITRGLEKRPCTEHVAEITGVTSANSNDVFIHTIRRSEDEAYAVIVKGGVKSVATVVKRSISVNTSTNVITANGHGYSNGDKVVFTTNNTIPTGLNTYTVYFVIDKSTNDFKVSLMNELK